MPKFQGVVMKIKNDFTTVYTEQGDFVQIPTPKVQPAIGEIIDVDLGKSKTFRSSLWQLASVAALLLIILSLSLFNVVSLPRNAAAAIVLNYGQNVELQVDNDAKVIKVQNLTDDSHINFEDQLKGMDIYQAVDVIIANAHLNNLMSNDKNLVLASIIPLTSSTTNVVAAEQLRSTMRDEMLKRNLFGDLMVTKVDQNLQKKAAQLGLNVNDYLIYRKLAQRGEVADPSTFTGRNIPEVLSKANISIENLYPEESCQIKPSNPGNNRSEPMEKNPTEPSESDQMGGMHQQPNGTENTTMPPKTPMPRMPSSDQESGMNSMNNMGR